MLLSVSSAAPLTRIPALLVFALLSWSEPTILRQAPGYISPSFASASNGYAIALWEEPDPNDLLSQYCCVYVRMRTPGSDWEPATLISDGTAILQLPGSVVIGEDGTAVVAWRQVVDQPEFQSQIVTRKFTPGVGWGPLQILSTNGTDPVLAMAPDGRVHIAFYEYPGLIAKTLSPDEDVWSQTTVLGETGYSGGAQLVVGNGSVYAAFTSFDFVSGQYIETAKLAMYTPDGWQSANRVSNPGKTAGVSQLLANNGHVVLSWMESDANRNPVQWVQRLTGPSAKFTVPQLSLIFVGGSFTGDAQAPCNIALSPDGTILATCSTPGAVVPGCFDSTRGGLIQAYYHYLELYRHPLEGDWSNAEIISDVHKRVGSPQALVNPLGDALVFWYAHIPCQRNSTEALSRIWNSFTAHWEPEAQLAVVNGGGFPRLQDMAADPRGTFHLLWLGSDTFPSPGLFTLFTTELSARTPRPGDLNGDGLVDCTDLSIVRAALGKGASESGFDSRADTNQDGVVDVKDLAFVAQLLPPGTICP